MEIVLKYFGVLIPISLNLLIHSISFFNLQKFDQYPNLGIGDFQVLLGRDGQLYVIDPLNIHVPSSEVLPYYSQVEEIVLKYFGVLIPISLNLLIHSISFFNVRNEDESSNLSSSCKNNKSGWSFKRYLRDTSVTGRLGDIQVNEDGSKTMNDKDQKIIHRWIWILIKFL
jgi:hypothetical protein